MNKIDMTLIIPAYNEAEGIAQTLDELIPEAKHNNWQILVVDDGSTDETASILEKYTSDIVVISHLQNRGYGASLKTGINSSNTDHIAFYDADGQHRPSDLIEMFNIRNQANMIIGERGATSHQSIARVPGKWLLTKIANILTGIKIPDLNSGLRVIERSIIRKYLHLFPNGFSFSTTSTIAFMNLGYTVIYHPIVVKKRVGKSSVKQLRHGTSTILLMLRLITLFNPLKIFLPTSLFLIVVGLIYGVIWGIILIYPEVKLISAAFFSILTGILIFLFGLVVDQISELRKHFFDSPD